MRLCVAVGLWVFTVGWWTPAAKCYSFLSTQRNMSALRQRHWTSPPLVALLLPLHVFSFQSQLIHLSHNPLRDAVEKQPCWKLLPHQMTIFPLLALQVVQPPVLSSRLNSLSPSHIITVKTVPWCLTFYSYYSILFGCWSFVCFILLAMRVTWLYDYFRNCRKCSLHLFVSIFYFVFYFAVFALLFRFSNPLRNYLINSVVTLSLL